MASADSEAMKLLPETEVVEVKSRKKLRIGLGVGLGVLVLIVIGVFVLCFAPQTLTLRCSISYKLPDCHKPDTLPSGDFPSNQSYADNKTAQRIVMAEHCWDTAWEILHNTGHWHLDKGKSLNSGLVYSKNFADFGRVSRLEAIVNASPEELFDLLTVHAAQMPEWDNTLVELKILENITENVDIVYTRTPSYANGIFKSRDYVNLRHYKVKDNAIMTSLCSTEHKDKPPKSHPIRGHNRPGGMIFVPVAGKPDSTFLKWAFSADVKGWVPQWALDSSLAGVMMDFLKELKNRIEFLHKQS